MNKPDINRRGLARLRLARLRLVFVAIAPLVLGCGGGPIASPTSAPASLEPRPSSLASVEIIEPAAGATIVGATAHVVLKLTGARIVTATTTTVRPNEGHVHLYLNNQLVSMNYGLEQDVPVIKGTVVLRAEFVAGDHAPFNPRVESPEVVFTVR